MKRTRAMLIALSICLVLTFGTSALAFDDLQNVPDQDKIEMLKKEHIVSGVTDKAFKPHQKTTYAEGIQLIVKGLHLNMDNLQFIKKPEASDYFTKVPNKAWYAQAFIIAQHHGMDLQKDMNPKETMTRQDFALYLSRAIAYKWDFAQTMEFRIFADSDQVSDEAAGAVQMLLKANIAKLDKGNKFRPIDRITRAESSVMIYKARVFVKDKALRDHTGDQEQPPVPLPQEKIDVQIQAVNMSVNEVTLVWGERANSGYRITIDRIQFVDDQSAIIFYQLHQPDPGKIYPQVITDAKANTYVGAEYKVTAKQMK